MHRNSKIAIAVAVVVICCFIIILPIVPVEEPYIETYTELEPYTRTAKYEVVSAQLKEELDPFGKWVYHASIIKVKNIDPKGGTFKVTHYLYDVNGLFGSKTTSEYLAAGQTKTFREEFDTQWLQDVRGEYTVSAPTVTDERLVTKERILYKTVYKSIIQLLTG